MRKDHSCRWRSKAGKHRMRQCGKEDAPVGSLEAGGSLSSSILSWSRDALLKSSAREISLPARPLTCAMDALTSSMSALTASSSDSSFTAAAVRAAKALLCVSPSAIAVPAGSRRGQRTGTQCHHTTDIMSLRNGAGRCTAGSPEQRRFGASRGETHVFGGLPCRRLHDAHVLLTTLSGSYGRDN